MLGNICQDLVQLYRTKAECPHQRCRAELRRTGSPLGTTAEDSAAWSAGLASAVAPDRRPGPSRCAHPMKTARNGTGWRGSGPIARDAPLWRAARPSACRRGSHSRVTAWPRDDSAGPRPIGEAGIGCV